MLLFESFNWTTRCSDLRCPFASHAAEHLFLWWRRVDACKQHQQIHFIINFGMRYPRLVLFFIFMKHDASHGLCCEIILTTHCCTYPLCVTSVWRKPNFLNISTTVSIGVWSVTVMGAISRIFFSFNGGGPRFWTGDIDVNRTTDWPLMPSINRLAFAVDSNEMRDHEYKKLNLKNVHAYSPLTNG